MARGKRRLANEINVVPYIDVMLVLLIIFMVTAPLLTSGVKVDLPHAPAQPLEFDQDNEPLILTVQSDGSLYLNIGPDPKAAITPQDVIKYATIALQKRPERAVAVKGDNAGAYGDVVRAMVLLQQSGAIKVGLLTDNLPEDEQSASVSKK